MVLDRPTTLERREYLDAVAKARGKAAADELRSKMMEIWEMRRGPDAA